MALKNIESIINVLVAQRLYLYWSILSSSLCFFPSHLSGKSHALCESLFRLQPVVWFHRMGHTPLNLQRSFNQRESRLCFSQQNMNVSRINAGEKHIYSSTGRNKDGQFKEAWESIYCLFMCLWVIDQWGLGSTLMAVIMPDEPMFVLKSRQKPERGTIEWI